MLATAGDAQLNSKWIVASRLFSPEKPQPTIWLTDINAVITDTINPPTTMLMTMIAAGPAIPRIGQCGCTAGYNCCFHSQEYFISLQITK